VIQRCRHLRALTDRVQRSPWKGYESAGIAAESSAGMFLSNT